MAMSLNKVTLIGNVGKDPEMRSTSDGREIANLTIATGESWRDKATGEKKERTEWHRVVVFNEAIVGVIKNYVKKGAKLYIEGSLQTRKWVDASGIEKYTTEVVLMNFNSSVILLDSRNSSNSEQSSSQDSSKQYEAQAFDHSEMDDEIPF